MPTYRITNRVTGEVEIVVAPYAQDACELLGWLIGNCHVQAVRDSAGADKPDGLDDETREFLRKLADHHRREGR